MGVTLSFDTPPTIGLLPLATKRGRGLPSGSTIPRIEAAATRLVPNSAAYAEVCGFPTGDPLPVTYPDVLTRGLQLAVLTHAEFPLPLLGILHVRQRITQARAIRAGEGLSGRAWVEGHRPARRGIEFDLHSVVEADGVELWHGVTTILSRAVRGDGEKRPAPQPTPFTARRSAGWTLPPDLGRRYAAVSGDGNPIHLYPLTARLFGFKRPIAHGWWVLARALAELDHEVPEACTIEARFVSPVALPGSVIFHAGPTSRGHAFEVLGRKGVCVAGEVVGG